MKKSSQIFTVLTCTLTLVFGQTVIRDDFSNLDNWSELTFPKIANHTLYQVELQNDDTVLRASTDSSASGLVFNKHFNVYETQLVRWRWKISNVFVNGDATRKSGDDYALRIYVMFEYDSETAGFFEKALFESLKLIYGEYPPYKSLNYIWANRQHRKYILPNTYTDRAQMIAVESGSENVGRWLTEEVNILADYRRVFGDDPPKLASLAIMSDSDNTGESAQAYLDFIEVLSIPEGRSK